MNALNKEESDRLLALLEKHVRQSNLSQREVERRLGLSQGYLGSLFRGRIQLKVSHVYGLARVLEMEPLYFFLHAAPPGGAEWLMKQLEIGTNLFLPLVSTKQLPTHQEMLEIVRKTVKSELERLFGASEPEPEDPDQT